MGERCCLTTAPSYRISSVAGADVPAFVERSSGATFGSSRMYVSPGLMAAQNGLAFCQEAFRTRMSVLELGDQTRELADAVQSISKGPRIETLLQADFYERFGAAIARANSGVAITHLGLADPRPEALEAGQAYYERLASIVEDNPAVIFRRVEATSDQKNRLA